VKVFDATNIGEAFRYMQKGQHIGKIVLRIPEYTDLLPIAKEQRPLSFKPDASYLLVGGLGGLGRAVSNWMVENGARHLIYLSRSAGKTPADQDLFKELEAQGCQVIAIAGSVTRLEDVQRAANATTQPVSGVIQMSMVLRVREFGNFLVMAADMFVGSCTLAAHS
jgi:3-dehydroquinate dehydratase